MAPSFTIANRQRKLDLKPFKLQEMAQTIGSGVCRNLKEDPWQSLTGKNLEDLESLGIFSIVFVSDRKIREMNRHWRGKDKATDVLSFPLDMEPEFEGTPFEVGEIIVSVEKAVEQARDYNHGVDRELAFLITHGILHVLGFDHESPEEEKEMFGRQRKILEACGYHR